jgi:hypothetical protein
LILADRRPVCKVPDRVAIRGSDRCQLSAVRVVVVYKRAGVGEADPG